MAGRVLVTGGASGIGAETCRVLAAAGWEPVAADLEAGDGVVALDVTDEAAWDRVLDAATPLVGLVNCAGIRTRSMITDTPVADFERHLRINVTGTWLGIRGFLRRHRADTSELRPGTSEGPTETPGAGPDTSELRPGATTDGPTVTPAAGPEAPELRPGTSDGPTVTPGAGPEAPATGARRSGAIVNVASVNAEIAVSGQAHYAASKGAVAALTRAAAVEAAPLGVRVNAIAPGGIRTPMTAERLDDPSQVAWFGARVPLGRVGEPEEIAEVIEFLLSDRASYITGEILFADGGWHAHA